MSLLLVCFGNYWCFQKLLVVSHQETSPGDGAERVKSFPFPGADGARRQRGGMQTRSEPILAQLKQPVSLGKEPPGSVSPGDGGRKMSVLPILAERCLSSPSWHVPRARQRGRILFQLTPLICFCQGLFFCFCSVILGHGDGGDLQCPPRSKGCLCMCAVSPLFSPAQWMVHSVSWLLPSPVVFSDGSFVYLSSLSVLKGCFVPRFQSCGWLVVFQPEDHRLEFDACDFSKVQTVGGRNAERR